MYCICTDIRDKGLSLLVAMEHDLQHILLVVLCPCTNGQFSDLNTGRAESGSVAIHQVLGRLHMGYGASEVLVPRLLCVCVCVCVTRGPLKLLLFLYSHE